MKWSVNKKYFVALLVLLLAIGWIFWDNYNFKTSQRGLWLESIKVKKERLEFRFIGRFDFYALLIVSSAESLESGVYLGSPDDVVDIFRMNNRILWSMTNPVVVSGYTPDLEIERLPFSLNVMGPQMSEIGNFTSSSDTLYVINCSDQYSYNVWRLDEKIEY